MLVHPEITRALSQEHLRDLQRTRGRRVPTTRPKIGARSAVGLIRRLDRYRSRPRPAFAPTTPEIAVAIATAIDAQQLETLAALDSQPPPLGAALLARAGGELVAAIDLTDGRVLADPFRRTADVVALLELRAAQLRLDRPAAAARTQRPASATVTL